MIFYLCLIKKIIGAKNEFELNKNTIETNINQKQYMYQPENNDKHLSSVAINPSKSIFNRNINTEAVTDIFPSNSAENKDLFTNNNNLKIFSDSCKDSIKNISNKCKLEAKTIQRNLHSLKNCNIEEQKKDMQQNDISDDSNSSLTSVAQIYDQEYYFFYKPKECLTKNYEKISSLKPRNVENQKKYMSPVPDLYDLDEKEQDIINKNKAGEKIDEILNINNTNKNNKEKNNYQKRKDLGNEGTEKIQAVITGYNEFHDYRKQNLCVKDDLEKTKNGFIDALSDSELLKLEKLEMEIQKYIDIDDCEFREEKLYYKTFFDSIKSLQNGWNFLNYHKSCYLHSENFFDLNKKHEKRMKDLYFSSENIIEGWCEFLKDCEKKDIKIKKEKHKERKEIVKEEKLHNKFNIKYVEFVRKDQTSRLNKFFSFKFKTGKYFYGNLTLKDSGILEIKEIFEYNVLQFRYNLLIENLDFYYENLNSIEKIICVHQDSIEKFYLEKRCKKLYKQFLKDIKILKKMKTFMKNRIRKIETNYINYFLKKLDKIYSKGIKRLESSLFS